MSVQPIVRASSLSQQVYDQLQKLILSGAIEPGAKVNEVSIAEQLGVSRAPVREATRSLVRAGLLVAVPARGVFVREMSDSEIGENYDVRALLTGLMCARAAERRTDAHLATMRDQVERMDVAIAKGAIVQYYRVNLDFHSLIATIADHGCSSRIYDDLIRETHLLRRSLAAPIQTNDEHRSIVEAIAAADAAGARRLGEGHVLNGKKRWLASLDQPREQ